METETLTTNETGQAYGSLAAAKTYIATKYGDTYAAWRALNANDDDRKRTLITAKAYIDSQVWQDAYASDTARDAVTAFVSASYELAVMILADPTVVTLADQGSNIQQVSASGASVTYFNSTTKAAPKLPPVLMRLVGQYLAAASGITATAGWGQSGSSTDPMSECEQDKRNRPY